MAFPGDSPWDFTAAQKLCGDCKKNRVALPEHAMGNPPKNAARTLRNTLRRPLKHIAGTTKYAARTPGNSIRVIIIGLKKENCKNLLEREGVKNIIFQGLLEGSTGTSPDQGEGLRGGGNLV